MSGEDRMDNHSDKHGLGHKQPRGFLAGLLIVRSFISRLISLVSVTEQDLKDAGVYRH
jgi:hypothetical protein